MQLPVHSQTSDNGNAALCRHCLFTSEESLSKAFFSICRTRSRLMLNEFRYHPTCSGFGQHPVLMMYCSRSSSFSYTEPKFWLYTSAPVVPIFWLQYFPDGQQSYRFFMTVFVIADTDVQRTVAADTAVHFGNVLFINHQFMCNSLDHFRLKFLISYNPKRAFIRLRL